MKFNNISFIFFRLKFSKYYHVNDNNLFIELRKKTSRVKYFEYLNSFEIEHFF